VHGLPTLGADTIAEALNESMDGITFVVDQTLRGMLKGLGLDELRRFAQLPDHLREFPQLAAAGDLHAGEHIDAVVQLLEVFDPHTGADNNSTSAACSSVLASHAVCSRCRGTRWRSRCDEMVVRWTPKASASRLMVAPA
jgi:hypothetical protein